MNLQALERVAPLPFRFDLSAMIASPSAKRLLSNATMSEGAHNLYAANRKGTLRRAASYPIIEEARVMNESMREGEHIPIDVFEQLLRKRVGWTDEVVTPFAKRPVRADEPTKNPPSKKAGDVEQPPACNIDR